jgi:hypothetical protein
VQTVDKVLTGSPLHLPYVAELAIQVKIYTSQMYARALNFGSQFDYRKPGIVWTSAGPFNTA